jgi:hypothetical protein
MCLLQDRIKFAFFNLSNVIADETESKKHSANFSFILIIIAKFNAIVIWWMTKTAIAWYQLDKHISATTDTHATIELLEAMFSLRSSVLAKDINGRGQPLRRQITVHMTFSFNNNKFTVGGILGYQRAFDITWYPGFCYKLHKLKLSTSFIKLIISFLSEQEFTVCAEDEVSTLRGCLKELLYSWYIHTYMHTH